MATLFEIQDEIRSLVDEETGEIADIEAFEQLNLTLDEKVKNIALWVLNLKSDMKQYEEQEKRFAEKKATAKNKAERLTALLEAFLKGEKRSFPEVNISYRKSESVTVADGVKLDECYLRYKEPEVNKTALKEALKSGKEIEGVTLEVRQNIQIR